jgi:hypothetical protein
MAQPPVGDFTVRPIWGGGDQVVQGTNLKGGDQGLVVLKTHLRVVTD